MGKIDYGKIEELLKSLKVDDGEYRISYQMLPINETNVYEEDGTKLVDLKASVEVEVISTGEKAKFPVDLLKIPHYGESGFTIRGKSKQVISLYTISYGWFVHEKNNSFRTDFLKLSTERGSNFTIYVNDFGLRVTTGKASSMPSVPLAIFLKALTGKSFDELKANIGPNSVYANTSFSIDEPTWEEAMDIVIKTFLRDYATGRKDEVYRNLSVSDKFTSIIFKRFLSPSNLYLGNTAGVRFSSSVSFKERCKNTYLFKDISLRGYSFRKGDSLDARMLETLDYLPIDEIQVTSSGQKRYTVRKHSIHNFRALGSTLEETVRVGNRTFEKGLVLTIEDLKEMEQSKLSRIVVSYDGKVEECTRKVFTGALDPDDIISMVQVYIDSLNGLDAKSNVYGLSNQNLRTLDIEIAALVTRNCNYISSAIRDEIESGGYSSDLLQRVLLLQKPKTDGLVEFIASAETRVSQQAEINNTIQRLSKEYRASKDVKRSSGGMTNVQQDQFGRIDPIHSPESSNIGLVHTMSFFAKTNEFGFLCMPVIRVNNGEVVSDEVVYLSADEQKDQFIAEWNETFRNPDGTKKKSVLAMSVETFLEVPIEDVRYKQVGPYDTMSPARMQIALQEFANNKRNLMGINQIQQAVPLINNERPLVSSGGDSLLGDGVIEARHLLESYYNNYGASFRIPKSEFLQYSLKLKSVQTLKTTRVLTLEIVELPGHLVNCEVPFIQKANSGAMFTYKINNATKGIFKDRDIITYSSDYDIRKKKIHMFADFGHMKVDERDFERAVGPARNVIVAYKTYESSTIDDAVLISDVLVGKNLYTAMDLHAITYELQDERYDKAKGISDIEYFGFSHSKSSGFSPHMQSNGLPALGSNLKPGDIAIGVKMERREVSKEGMKSQPPRDKHITLESTVAGQVVSARIEGNRATVMLAELKPIEIGDKVAGRHGNKGVIAKIMREDEMPYDPVTGMKIQVVLNPQAVPSRMNVAQIIEAVLGMCALLRGEIIVVTPYKSGVLEYTKKLAAETGVKPMMLRDGRTGQMFKRPINVGVIYMPALEHKSSHKIKHIGLSSRVDPVFNQPSKGQGGQAMGEMETWVFEALGVRRVLNDLMSVQSDDLPAIQTVRGSIWEGVDELDVEGTNNNDQLLQVFFRGLGTEATMHEDGSLSFRPLTDDIILSLSNTPVDINNKSSLESGEIFGATTNHLSKFRHRNNWSYFPLHCEMVHPFHIVKGKINKFLMVYRWKFTKTKGWSLEEHVATENFLKDLVAGRAYIHRVEHPDNGLVYVEGTPPESSEYSEIKAETGIPALVKVLKTTTLEPVKAYHLKKRDNAKTSATVAKHIVALRELEDFEKTGATLSDFVTSYFPVMPLAFRPRPKFDHILQDFDHYYGRIMDEVVRYRSSSVKTVEGIYNIYLRIVEFTGLTYTGEVQENTQYKSLIKYFTRRDGPDSKHGRVRESMLKKRILMSGRSVIIPKRDVKRPPTHIGIPLKMALNIYSLQLASLLKRTFSHYDLTTDTWETLISVMATNRNMFNKTVDSLHLDISTQEFYDKVYATISAYIEGYKNPETGQWEVLPRVVLAGRQPSLHQFSIKAFYPVLVSGNCIEVDPIVQKGYNGDFDGDTFWLAGLVNQAACDEAIARMSPKVGVINPKDGSVILEHSQDIRLGVYYATMLYDNKDTVEGDSRYEIQNAKFYSNLDLLETDIDLGLVSVHDLVVYNRKGKVYLSTAGRILFNNILGDLGFTDEEFSNPLQLQNVRKGTFKDLKFDGLISGSGGSRKQPKYGNLTKITKWTYEHPDIDLDRNMEIYQKISEFGFKYADMSGISLYLEDFAENPLTPVLIEKANKSAREINDLYFLGVISESERKEELISLYKACKDKVRKVFMKSFDRNNNMFIMFDSGARGSEDQIMQACGIIGILQKSKTEALETPVLTNYSKGLSCYESLQSSYSTRIGVASTQNETSVSGELTRSAVYMGSGFKIVEHDCGADFEDFKIRYAEPTGRVRGPNGEDLTIQSLEGKRLVGDDRAVKHLRNFLHRGMITSKAIELLLKKKIHSIQCEDGEYRIFYKLDSLMPSLLSHREAEGLPGLGQGKFINKRVIKHIQDENLETVRVRTILSCRSVGGCCARCYGAEYNTNRYPKVGSNKGVESAQAIGEPANQLTLSLFHKGGQAGEGIDQGVQLYMATLATGFPKALRAAKLAQIEGYVSNGPNKSVVYVTPEGGTPVPHHIKDSLEVLEGEYVEVGEKLTTGNIVIRDPITNPTREQIRFVQMALIDLHFRIFENNGIKVFARHFEIFVRMQASRATILQSFNEKFEPGSVHEINEILREKDDAVTFDFDIASDTEVIEMYGGTQTLLAYGWAGDNLGKAVSTGKVSRRTSFIGKMYTGQDVREGAETKLFYQPYGRHVPERKVLLDDESDQMAEILLDDRIIQEIRQEVPVESTIDWDNLFDEEPDQKPQEIVTIPHIDLEEEEEEVKQPTSFGKMPELHRSNFFG